MISALGIDSGRITGNPEVIRLSVQRMPDKAPTRRAFLNLSHDRGLPKKILDNRYTDTIT